MNDQNTAIVTTTYRRLENFLYLMNIAPLRTYKAWDGSTAWDYEDTPELRLATSTFKELEAQLKAMRGSAVNE